MKLIPFKSINQVIFFCFFVALIPLVFGLYKTKNYISEFTKANKTHISRLVEGTRNIRQLGTLQIELERCVYQYIELEQLELRKQCQELVEAATAVARSFQLLEISGTELLIDSIISFLSFTKESILNIKENSNTTKLFNKKVSLFNQKLEESRKIEAILHSSIQKYEQDSDKNMDKLSKELSELFLYLVPFSIMLIFLFSAIISRPIKKLKHALYLLEHQKLSERHSHLGGLSDMQNIGKQLLGLQEKLVSSETAKQSFVRHFSHELKTPIASLKEGTSLLIDEVPGPVNHAQKRILGIIEKSTTALNQGIDQLLRYQKAILYRNLDYKLINFSKLIDETVERYVLEIDINHIKISLEGEPIEIYADESKLQAVIDNLLSNAIKFSPKKSTIRLIWFYSSNQLIFRISDQGPGIKNCDVEKVFLPFEKSNHHSQPNITGSGIGLSVAKECIELHGGNLEIKQSEFGATFEFSLPLKLKSKPTLKKQLV